MGLVVFVGFGLHVVFGVVVLVASCVVVVHVDFAVDSVT